MSETPTRAQQAFLTLFIASFLSFKNKNRKWYFRGASCSLIWRRGNTKEERARLRQVKFHNVIALPLFKCCTCASDISAVASKLQIGVVTKLLRWYLLMLMLIITYEISFERSREKLWNSREKASEDVGEAEEEERKKCIEDASPHKRNQTNYRKNVAINEFAWASREIERAAFRFQLGFSLLRALGVHLFSPIPNVVDLS